MHRIALVAAALAGLALVAGFGCSGGPSQPNIILVVLDTVRLDATGLVAKSQPWSALDHSLTPNLDRLASEGTAYTNAWSVAPWTVPSHASIFTGLLPSQHYCTFRNTRLDPDHPTMAALLDDAGYQTAAFYSNPWLADRTTGLLNGFATREEAPVGGLSTMVARTGDQGGRQTLRNVKAWLSGRDRGKPSLIFVNFLEAHLPYDPPLDYREAHLGDLPPGESVSIRWGHQFNAGLFEGDTIDWLKIRRLYGADVWTADRLLGRLRAMLEEDGIWESSIVVVVSDHGENLGENGAFEHQFSLHENLLAVPLVIRYPEPAVATQPNPDPVMTTDLFSSVLDWARVAEGPRPVFSRSLQAAAEASPRALIAEYSGPSVGLLGMLESMNPELDSHRLKQPLRSIRMGSYRLTEAGDGRRELHDLAADPLQGRDISGQNPGIVAKLQAFLNSALSGETPGDPQAAEMDAATRKQLESLGYVN